MSVTALARPPHRTLPARVWGAVVTAWAVVTGIGPLAGAALLVGVGGKALFFALGLLLSLPMLRRLYRRFGTLVAPALAVAAFAAVFTFSSLVIAPRLTGSEKTPSAPGIQQPDNHASHHSGAGAK